MVSRCKRFHPSRRAQWFWTFSRFLQKYLQIARIRGRRGRFPNQRRVCENVWIENGLRKYLLKSAQRVMRMLYYELKISDSIIGPSKV